MSLDATHTRLTKIGTVTIYPDDINGVQITAEGFEAENASCRDLAVLAQLWAIGELQRSVMGDVQQPGGGNSGVD